MWLAGAAASAFFLLLEASRLVGGAAGDTRAAGPLLPPADFLTDLASEFGFSTLRLPTFDDEDASLATALSVVADGGTAVTSAAASGADPQEDEEATVHADCDESTSLAATALIRKHHSFHPVSCKMAVLELRELRLDSRLFFYEVLKDGSVGLDECYSVGGGPDRCQEVARWSAASKSLQFVLGEEIWLRRSDLGGAVFREADDTRGYRMVHAVLGVLAEAMNFTAVADSGGGRETYDGIVDLLAAGRADVSSIGLSVTAERAEKIDFSVGVYRIKNTLWAWKRSGGPRDFWAYVGLFRWRAWAGALAVAAAMVAAVGAVYGKGLLRSASMVGALFVRGDWDEKEEVSGRRLSSRVLHQTACVFAFVTFATYAAVLTSLMTTGPPGIPISELSHVAAAGYRVVVILDTAQASHFLRPQSNDSVFASLYRQTMAGRSDAFLTSRDDVVSVLESDPYALYYGTTGALWYLGNKLLPLHLKDSSTETVALGLRKDSELRELLDYHLVKLKESGVMDKLWEEHVREREIAMREANRPAEDAFAMGCGNVLFLFYVLLGGLAAAGVAATAERAVGAWRRYR